MGAAQFVITPYFAALSLLVLVLAVYFPGLDGFLVFDDVGALAKNPTLHWQHLGWSEWVGAVSSGAGGGPLGRPISMWSFGLNYYLGGDHPLPGLKLTNIVLHAVCGLLVYLLAGRLLPYWWRDTQPQGLIRWLAGGVALLWVLHPLHVSTVLYTVQRMTVLSALFTLVGLLAFVHGREQLIVGRRQGVWWIAATLLAGGLAVLSKESGALLGHLELVVELLFFRLSVAPCIEPWTKRFTIVAVALPVVLVTGYLVYLSVFPLPRYEFRDFNLTQRLMTEARVLWFYVALLLVPDHGYMGLYHDDVIVSRGLLQPWTTLVAVVAWFGLLVASVYAWRKRLILPLVFALWWFLVGHLLESTVVPLELVFEHRNYLPSVGVVMALAFYLAAWLHWAVRWEKTLPVDEMFMDCQPPSERHVGGLPLLPPLGVVVVVGVLWITEVHTRVAEWSAPRLFFSHLLLSHPDSPTAWGDAGAFMEQAGDLSSAATNYRKAASLNEREAGYAVTAVYLLMASGQHYEIELGMAEQRLSRYPLSATTILSLMDFVDHAQQNNLYQSVAIRLLRLAVANPVWFKSDLRGLAYYRLGHCEYRAGHPEVALSDWEQASDLVREHTVEWRGLMLDLVHYYLAHGMPEKARSALAEVAASGLAGVDSEQQRLFADATRTLSSEVVHP